MNAEPRRRGRPRHVPPTAPMPLPGDVALRALIPQGQALHLVATRQTAIALARATTHPAHPAQPSFANAYAELVLRAQQVTDAQIDVINAAAEKLAAAQAEYTAACAPVLAIIYPDLKVES